MLRTMIQNIAEHKMLLLAAFISLLAHVLLLGNYSFTLPSAINNRPSVKVQLQQAPAGNETIQPSVKQANAAARLPSPTPQATTNANAQIANNDEVAAIEDPAASPPTENTTLTEASSISTESIDTVQDLSANEALPDATSTEAISNTEINNPYAFVQTEFEVTRGDDAGTLGITQIIFKMDKQKNTYQLSSITEAKGVASLFLGKLEQYSEGQVDENGLKPTSYAYQYGSNSSKNQYARLSWTEGIIELSSKKGKKSEPLPIGTQDFLSFMYQFMFTPPLNTMQLTMTNGKYLRTYVYSFEGEETIATKLGDLKTIHLLKSGDSQEKTEIWLAADYRNIPVKIRKTEKNGEVIEQIATVIKTDNRD